MTKVADFISKVQAVHKTGIAGEHAYRPALHDLLKSMGNDLTPVNDPAKSNVGAPDFIVLKKDIAIGHVEAKDLNIDLRAMKGANRDQQKRYRAGLSNLIYTNCLDWDFYRNGDLVASVTIADLLTGIQPRADQFVKLENLLRDFVAQQPQTITSPKDLAQRMAGKANLIKDVLANTLIADTKHETDLASQYLAFKENLIHDITTEDFADIYAETIAYGMFAARLHDATPNTFSRQEALDLLPKSNPFLRSLFTYVAGYDLDDRIAWILDDLARVFQVCDVAKLMQGFGKLTGQNDPFLHFYETFLAAYNPAKRKARGVWYTPEPVVNFIVRAVDHILQKTFGLSDGLADTSKVTIDWDTGQTDKKGKAIAIKKEVHRVQILDPATGTGTFLAEVLKQIAPKVKSVAPGMWSQYIENDLIPRLHGFELLMASYAMCHMKLDMILTELGYKPTSEPPRLSVYLTNSLEEGEPANQTLPFTQWLSKEAKGANTIKRDMPIMCVIGNPPYLGEGGKSVGWLGQLMDDYKKEPGGKVKLKERNAKWLNDLYVKFIRLSSKLIEKNGEGVLGFITNHGYLDNPTFRGMRWHLLKTFDEIWVLDLHGNAKKKEVTPAGAPDKNVFDIQQGVAIIVAVKKKAGGPDLAKVMHGDLWGDQKAKYDQLKIAKLDKVLFKQSTPQAPQYFLPVRDYKLEAQYQSGFSLKKFFQVSVLGFQTHRDDFAIADTRQKIIDRVSDMKSTHLSDAEFHAKYHTKDNRDWLLASQRKQLRSDPSPDDNITRCLYRPFDVRWCHLSYRTMDYPRTEILQHVLHRENVSLLISRQLATEGYRHALVTDLPAESCAISLKTKEQNYVLPLYLYPDEQDLDQERRVNYNAKLYARLQKLANHPAKGKPDEIAVFDYIYGVLYSTDFRKNYAQFLKADFAHIPWPESPDIFWTISQRGTALRKLHLMEPTAIGDTPYPFMGNGENVVEAPALKDGRIWINKEQYFDNVPCGAWEMAIGGYEPAQKWLKDRRGTKLSFDDVKQYQKILKILSETDKALNSTNSTI